MSTKTIYLSAATPASQLQEIIDTAAAGTEIRLAAGTFTFDSTIRIDRDDISITGAGEGKTVITTTTKMLGDPVFHIGHDLNTPQVTASATLAATAKQDDHRLTLTPDHGVAPGDILYVTQANTQQLFDEIGDTKWQKDKPLRKVMAEVVAIEGDTVVLSRPLPFDFDPKLTEVDVLDVVENVDLGGFTIAGPLGTPDASVFENTVSDGYRATSILVASSNGVDLKDIEIDAPLSHGLTVERSTAFAVDTLEVSGAHNKGSGGNGYGVWIRDVYDSTFANLEVMDTRHAVVFGSYNTAIGNSVHVAETNRDINFHGGLDADNDVQVDASLRIGEETSYMSPSVFFNPGTSYGAPTDASANDVTFTNLIGTVRQEVIHASDAGAHIQTLGAADEVFGGLGNDTIDLGTGHDTAHASGGLDVVEGGSGVDTFVFQGRQDAYAVMRSGDGVKISNLMSESQLTGFEYVVFEDRVVALSDLQDTGPLIVVSERADTGGLTLHEGGAGWQRATFDGSGAMGDALEAASYNGTEDVTMIGNDGSNHIMGGTGDDWIEGRGGHDRVIGRTGADTLLGGTGNDTLYGGADDDLLFGGAGTDRMIGGTGGDTFVAGTGTNIVEDFSHTEGDMILFNSGGARANLAARAYLETGAVTDKLSVQDVTEAGQDALMLRYADESITLLNLSTDQFH